MDPGVSLPSLREFLRITQLLSYEGKLKKLKCCEVLDILKVLGQVGMRSIEEQRVRRYLNHFQTKSLTEQESMEQPYSLEDFFRTASLPETLKVAQKLGIVEFDDLSLITSADSGMMLPKKVECERFKRYLGKFKQQKAEGLIQPDPIDLRSFLAEAQLKPHKKSFEKLGVVESDDLLVIHRSDLPKLSQVEFDRFLRYRHSYQGRFFSFFTLQKTDFSGRFPKFKGALMQV